MKRWALYSFVYFIHSFIHHYLFLTGLGLCRRSSASLAAVSRSYSLVAVFRLLIAVSSLVAEHRLSVTQVLVVMACGLIVVAHRLSCPVACGIFLDQGSDLCPLRWQADS